MAKAKKHDPSDLEKDVLSVEQAAAYLSISRSTFFKLLNEPKSGIDKTGGKILGQWRFSRRKLLEWVETGGTGRG